MLAIASAVSFIVSVILVAVDKTAGTGFSSPLLWIGAGGAFLALHLAYPTAWPVRRP